MSRIKFTIVIREEELRTRKRSAPSVKVFRDRTKYSRKAKHRKASLEDGHAC